MVMVSGSGAVCVCVCVPVCVPSLPHPPDDQPPATPLLPNTHITTPMYIYLIQQWLNLSLFITQVE